MKASGLYCLAAVLFLVSCTTQKNGTYNYLENAKDSAIRAEIQVPQPVIQKGDLLSIRVYSKANGLDPRVDAPYNLEETGSAAAGGISRTGFLVDQDGNIEYPQIGRLHVEGLTREEVADLIKNKLQEELESPSVMVRFLNFKVSVLGEVKGPGTFTLPTERVTILEAMGLAGDVTQFGRKNNVMVAREKDGHIETGTIDLTSESMFTSPYYHLQQNDVVFVESTGRNYRQQERQELAQQIGIATSIMTAIALILNFIK